MCCFSQPVISVSATNIFARAGEGGRQFLAYSMSLHAKKHLAMILPLPVKQGVHEKDVQFINLKDYPDFFDDLFKGFPVPVMTRGAPADGQVALSAPPPASLEVVKVGDFEASFVPTVKDFSRLDARFCLPSGTWKKLPQYQDHGFAVFKLKPGVLKVHPMAFSFPRRNSKALFFPTVHIHDGQVHEKADFDHALYCQPNEHEHLELANWRESQGHATSFVKVDKAKGLVTADQHCYLKEMRGEFANRDTFVRVDG